MNPSLLYVPDLGETGSVLALPPEEAHYVARVCRARVGDLAEATDGRGTLARLRLLNVGSEVRAEVLSAGRTARGRHAWLWCGAPERGRADWLVEKLAELGVERFQPLDCGRDSWPAGPARMERWKRLAIAALRQSRRTLLLEIRPPASLEAALETATGEAGRWLADTGGGNPGPAPPKSTTEIGVVGPSGGFTDAERELLIGAGFEPLCLADGRLRTETAALSLASWLALPGGREERAKSAGGSGHP